MAIIRLNGGNKYIDDQKTMQVITDASVAADGQLQSPVIYAPGYSLLTGMVRSDASHSLALEAWWFTPTTGQDYVGWTSIVPTSTGQTGASQVQLISPYFKLTVFNKDTGSAHTMNVWASLLR